MSTVFSIDNVLGEQMIRIAAESDGLIVAVNEDGITATMALPRHDVQLLRDCLSQWLGDEDYTEVKAHRDRLLRQIRNRELADTGLYDEYGRPYK